MDARGRADNSVGMETHPRLNGRANGLAAALWAITAIFLAPAATHAMGPGAAGPPALSPRLAELARPALDSASDAVQAERLGLAPNGPGSLQRLGPEVLVNVRFEAGAIARLGALEAAGARVVDASRRYQTVAVAVAPEELRKLARTPGVAAVKESLEPIVRAEGATAVGGAGTCEGGEVISEGLGQLRVDEARQQFGLRGKGTTVGILSDSYDTATEAAGGGPIATHASRDTEGNDLPGPGGSCSGQQAGPAIFSDFNGGLDEGRAMMQIVHDLAPHAGLAFATAFLGELSFAENIELLAGPVSAGGAGAGVVADDVGYFEEPFFQDGPVAAAINKVSAEGTTYLTAAGNENIFEGDLESGNEIGSWEAPAFRDAPGCPAAVAAELEPGVACMDFDPGTEPGEADDTFEITVEPESGFILDLQWAEPWFGVEADLDAFVLSGGEVVASAIDDNTGTQRPVELLLWENEGPTPETVELAIARCFEACNPGADPGAEPRLKFILLEEGDGVAAIEYPESVGGDVVGPTIYGHAGAASAISLGAVRYNNAAKPEPFSSRGPVTHYFGPVSGTAPAPPLGVPESIAKPDLVATDCGATTFFAGFFSGAWRFCGTSAAAPHAAAVAALMSQGAPAATNTEIREALLDSALPVGAFGPEAVGAGLLDAVAALEEVGATPTVDDPASVAVPPLVPPPVPVPPAPAPPTAPAPTVAQPSLAAAPRTFFRHRPPKVVRTRKARARVVFRFGSDQAGAVFLCKVDSAGPFRRCRPRLARSFKPGRHVIRVKARNTAGSVDRTPALYRFRVIRRAR